MAYGGQTIEEGLKHPVLRTKRELLALIDEGAFLEGAPRRYPHEPIETWLDEMHLLGTGRHAGDTWTDPHVVRYEPIADEVSLQDALEDILKGLGGL